MCVIAKAAQFKTLILISDMLNCGYCMSDQAAKVYNKERL